MFLNDVINSPPNTNVQGKATPIKIGDVKFDSKSGKPHQQVVLNDGESEGKVKIWQGNNQPMTPDLIGVPCEFSLSNYRNNYGTFISGFWQSGQQKAPLKPLQTQQQQKPQTADKKEGTINNVQVRLDLVCAHLRGGIEPNLNDIKYWFHYITTGQEISDKNDDAPEPDSSIVGEGDEGDLPF